MTAFGFILPAANCAGLKVLASRRVPHHDLFVITGGDNGAIDLLGKTPDLTIGVRVHDVRIVLS